MMAAFIADMKDSVSFFGLMLFVVLGMVLWAAVPILFGTLFEIGYAAYCRFMGVPKPEGGHRFEAGNGVAIAAWAALAFWTVWLFMFFKKHHLAIVEWIKPIDVFAI